MRPWVWKDDPIFVEFYQVIGASAVRLGVPEVYPALQTRMVDVISSSALTAVALQWYTRVKYMTAHNSAIIAGGTVMRQDKYDELRRSSRKPSTAPQRVRTSFSTRRFARMMKRHTKSS